MFNPETKGFDIRPLALCVFHTLQSSNDFGQINILYLDMTGAVFSYTVTRVDRSQSADAALLQDPDSILTLFCRSLLSGTYLAVHCTLTP